MARALVLAALVLAVPLVPSAGAASTMQVPLDWTQGTFRAGLLGHGDPLWPNGTPAQAPDHAELAFHVSPCHRKLSPGLRYEPEGAFLDAAAGGIEVEAGLPYRFQLTLIAPNGTELRSTTIDEPDPSIGGPTVPFYTVDEPGRYVLRLELLEGALVDWELRVRGFAVAGEPTCDLWLNEVELNPDGLDAGKEWVELYNEGETRIDVSGWQLVGLGDGTGQGNATFTIPDGTVVPAGGYSKVVLDGQEVLDDVGEMVQLVAPSGGVLDASVPLNDAGDDEATNQRVPDGSQDWQLAPGTPGAPNAG